MPPNDFGVLSLSIGNADTFANVDFSKMPFYIEVSANGVNIGKSQILSVPVAEYAKRTGELTKEMLVGTWVCEFDRNVENSGSFYDDYSESYLSYKYMWYSQNRNKLVFNADGTCKSSEWHINWTVGCREGDTNYEGSEEDEYNYIIDGNTVILYNMERFSDDFSFTYHTPHFEGEAFELFYLPTLGVLTGGRGYVKQK